MLREVETREGESSVSDGGKKTFWGMFSKLRVGLSRAVRPPRPSMYLEKSQLNSIYANLDDLEILDTIGTRRAFCHPIDSIIDHVALARFFKVQVH